MARIAELRVNCPDEAAALRLAETLLAEGLAAAAHLHPPIRSLYVWRGELVRRPETPLTLRTALHRAEAAAFRLRALHPYETPGVTRSELEVAADYASWAEAATRAPT